MKIRHVEAIHAVMLTGSVSGAARLINLTQPAVTRTLQHAELHLGFPLFQRSRNRLIPTREALLLHAEIAKLFNQLEAVNRLAGSLRAGAVAQLRVMMVPALGQTVLPAALAAFRERHGDVRVAVRMLNSSEIVSALSLHEADVGFVFGPSQHPAVVGELICDSALVCVAPHGMFDARRHVELEDLIDKPVVMLDQGDYMSGVLVEARHEAGVDEQLGITVQTRHAALALAENGIGAALIDSFTAASADPKKVDILRLEPTLSLPTYALRQQSAETSVQLRHFIACFKNACMAVCSQTARPDAAPTRRSRSSEAN